MQWNLVDLSIHVHLMSSGFMGNAIFVDNSLFMKKMEPPIKFKLCKKQKHDNI